MLPMDGNDASDELKEGRGFELPYAELVDRGDYKITGLHPVFCALNFQDCIIILFIYIIIYIFMYIYTYIYIFINKYT